MMKLKWRLKRKITNEEEKDDEVEIEVEEKDCMKGMKEINCVFIHLIN